MTTSIEWRKSKRSSVQGGDCVELSTNVTGATLIRDSRDPGGPAVALTAAGLASLVRQIKADTL